ncbi:hypothetical protein [Cronobacter malonaticus]|uniref:hypothetical protein n=2 Tax=Cronobacter TaxID=413496 RepID=UPI000948A025|nr:hypothetical protein [Cronobacter malonaticus]PUX16045.1 hypothetical protein BS413_17320 [Cronobacter malonaticus]
MGIYADTKIVNGIKETNKIILADIERHKAIIANNAYENATKEEIFYTTLASAWKDFFRLISAAQSKLDENTKFNQRYIPQYIEFTISDYDSDKVIFLSNLLRVLYEYYFWTGDKVNVHYMSNDNLTSLEKTFGPDLSPYTQFAWIRDTLAISLAQWVINSDEFQEAKKLINTIDSNKNEIIKNISQLGGAIINEIESAQKNSSQIIDDQLSKTKKEIEGVKNHADDALSHISDTYQEIKGLQERVENLRSEYNFVGLSSGFNKIKEKKEKELKDTQINYMNLFGCIFIAPVAVALIHFILPNLYPKDYSAIFLILPFFTIEMILIYFFRLSYLEAKSIRTQLVQIELRLSLCAFIDGYVEYRKKNNTNVEKVLDCFDSLIFSPIQTNENNIPAMFDGVEALAGLADKVIKK